MFTLYKSWEALEIELQSKIHSLYGYVVKIMVRIEQFKIVVFNEASSWDWVRQSSRSWEEAARVEPTNEIRREWLIRYNIRGMEALNREGYNGWN